MVSSHLAARNLVRRKSRTILTVIGITLAIAFTVGLLSVSEGFLLSFNKTIKKRGVDVFVVPKEKGGVPFFMGRLGSKGELPEDYAQRLEKIKEVKFVIPVKVVVADLDPFSANMPLIVDGIPVSALPKIRSYCRLTQGRMLNDQDKKSLVLGYNVAKDRKLKVGDEQPILEEPFRVVGIFEQTGTVSDFKTYAPLPTVQRLFGEKGKIDYLEIKAREVDQMEVLVKKVKEQFPHLSAFPLEQVVRQMKEMLAVARAIHLSVASFALLIGVLFVACTQVWSISERIKEFATLRVIGASKSFIFKTILIESIILTGLGGILGCFCGFGLSKVITLLLQRIAHLYLEAQVTPRLFLGGMLISILIGTLSSILPALKIARKNMAESLRYE